MKNARYVALFVAIQLFGWVVLFVPGLFVCGALAALSEWSPAISPVTGHPIMVWPRWANWAWGNDEDGVISARELEQHPTWGPRLRAFWWTALRNSFNNLRFWPGVSGVGRPLWLKQFTWRGQIKHVKAGWMNDGWPTCGIGDGPW
jgi:hypothetical protein